MKLFEKIKAFFSRNKNKLLLEEGNVQVKEEQLNDKNNNQEDFVNSLREAAQPDFMKLNDCEKKIVQVIEEFKKLFVKMLQDKGVTYVSETGYFADIAINAKAHYPEVASRINRVLYYYSEEDDSEEKLDYMMRLYKIIKESTYEN